ncbi:auxin-responsive protein SAUR71 [Brachypodium distachyon]|uniref:Uncharacterized protein n=1 Tax=Brachypodium distachyon TaxID=15368 RepID=I1J2Z1_BRADI|nr:auxin-responsive protein SAUR71 [Brachypodium distachyon]KQJ85129.1 hypothetical protein BRADI_5g25010v3 [Brachypodium distachyon]|eukprot:XP_003579432.1 auxin-responsive protein SAUR71 [Brachypodium distachyon]
MCKVSIAAPSLVRWLRRAVARRWRRSRSGAAASVPAGHVAVVVGGGGGGEEGGAGAGSARFVVRVADLGHPAFLELLRDAEEEYGFPSGASGPLALPCDEARLRDVLRQVSASSSSSSREERLCQRFRGVSARRQRELSRRPLLQGMGVEKLVL